MRNAEKIIDKIRRNIATQKNIDSLKEFLNSPDLNQEVFAQHLLGLNLDILSDQFKDFLAQLPRGIIKIFEDYGKKDNPQSLFYMAFYIFKINNDPRDFRGVARLRKAFKNGHYGARCALMKIDNEVDRTALFSLEVHQLLSENVALANRNEKLNAKLLAAREEIRRLSAVPEIKSAPQISQSIPTSMVAAEEKPSTPARAESVKEERITRRVSSGAELSIAYSPDNLWTNPYNPDNWSAHGSSTKKKDGDSQSSSSKRLRLSKSEEGSE